MPVLSTAWFLTKIETAKGGTFHFTYADEEMIDLHDEVDYDWYGRHHTKRLVSISSEFGSVIFTSDLSRADRSISAIHGSSITTPSGRIKKIELKDEFNESAFKIHYNPQKECLFYTFDITGAIEGKWEDELSVYIFTPLVNVNDVEDIEISSTLGY